MPDEGRSRPIRCGRPAARGRGHRSTTERSCVLSTRCPEVGFRAATRRRAVSSHALRRNAVSALSTAARLGRGVPSKAIAECA